MKSGNPSTEVYSFVDPGAPQWVCLKNVDRVPACCNSPVSNMLKMRERVWTNEGIVGERGIDEMRGADWAAVSECDAESGARWNGKQGDVVIGRLDL